MANVQIELDLSHFGILICGFLMVGHHSEQFFPIYIAGGIAYGFGDIRKKSVSLQ